MKESYSKIGFVEGVVVLKEEARQEGFDHGVKRGSSFGFKCGYIKGLTKILKFYNDKQKILNSDRINEISSSNEIINQTILNNQNIKTENNGVEEESTLLKNEINRILTEMESNGIKPPTLPQKFSK